MEFILDASTYNDKVYQDNFKKSRVEGHKVIVDTTLEEIVRVAEVLNEEIVITPTKKLPSDSKIPILEIYDGYRE